MKVKVDNKNLNNSAYEHRLSTDEIVAAISKICLPEPSEVDVEEKDLGLALANYDYFVKPGLPRKMFMSAFAHIFSEAKKLNNGQTTDAMYWNQLLSLMRSFFDRAYFEAQIVRRRFNPASKKKLAAQMKRFSQEQLYAFFSYMFIYKADHSLFISTYNGNIFWEAIANECRAVGLNVPRELDSVEGQRFLKMNPNFYFKVLSVKQISTLLLEAIDLDMNIAASAAKRLNEQGVYAMAKYLDLKVREMSA